MGRSINRAVIPAAGLGTRFLPVTRVVPKALLPVLDTPAIHMVVEEIAAAGIPSVGVVVPPGRDVIGSYFSVDSDHQSALLAAGLTPAAADLRRVAEMADVSTVVQESPGGLGQAVSAAADWIGGEPFAVALPDDLFWSERPAIGELIAHFDRLSASVIAVRRAPREMLSSLGIIAAEPMGNRLHRVTGLVEKPPLDAAPSDLAIVGRYALTNSVLDALEETQPDGRGEVQITDAISRLLDGEEVYACELGGHHVDVGTPLGMLEAALHEGMRRPEMADRLAGLIDVHRARDPR